MLDLLAKAAMLYAKKQGSLNKIMQTDYVNSLDIEFVFYVEF